MRLDRKQQFRFVPLTGEEADRVLGHMSWEQRFGSSHLLYPDGHILSGAQGMLEGIAMLLPPLKPLIRLYQIMPGSARLADRVYRWIADNRSAQCKAGQPH